jgi:putative toxin-antitoxin system antitoxin component (TIGR02293 family)
MSNYESKNPKSFSNDPAAIYLNSNPYHAIDPLLLVQEARKGISKSYLLKISEALSLTLIELSNILHISIRSIQRYAANKKMDIDVSAKALQLENLRRRGVTIFGDNQAFNNWLRSPIMALDNNTPLAYLDTPFGFDMVEQLLGRIEHGIY